jgi:hypothetical protein
MVTSNLRKKYYGYDPFIGQLAYYMVSIMERDPFRTLPIPEILRRTYWAPDTNLLSTREHPTNSPPTDELKTNASSMPAKQLKKDIKKEMYSLLNPQYVDNPLTESSDFEEVELEIANTYHKAKSNMST